MNIGGQTFDLVFDTGSSDLWVFSSDLPVMQQKGHKIYNPSLSNTSNILSGETWKILYGDGSHGAAGVVYTDTVAIGTSLVQNQAVQVPVKLTSEFLKDTSFDGQSSCVLLQFLYSDMETYSS